MRLDVYRQPGDLYDSWDIVFPSPCGEEVSATAAQDVRVLDIIEFPSPYGEEVSATEN